MKLPNNNVINKISIVFESYHLNISINVEGHLIFWNFIAF
jgi:hypothetical protein